MRHRDDCNPKDITVLGPRDNDQTENLENQKISTTLLIGGEGERIADGQSLTQWSNYTIMDSGMGRESSLVWPVQILPCSSLRSSGVESEPKLLARAETIIIFRIRLRQGNSML